MDKYKNLIQKRIANAILDHELSDKQKIRLMRVAIDDLVQVATESKTEPEPEAFHWPGRHDDFPFFTWDPAQRIIQAHADNFAKDISYAEKLRRAGQCSATEEEAKFVERQQAAELELIDRIQEFNGGWRPDWKESSQKKWRPCLEYIGHNIQLRVKHWTTIQNLPACYYGKSKEIWGRIIEELGEDKIKLALWGI